MKTRRWAPFASASLPTCRTASRFSLLKGLRLPTSDARPAACTTTLSPPPETSNAPSMSARNRSRSVTSLCTGTTDPAATSFCHRASLFRWTRASTCQPWATNSSTIHEPIKPAAPVTSAVLGKSGPDVTRSRRTRDPPRRKFAVPGPCPPASASASRSHVADTLFASPPGTSPGS